MSNKFRTCNICEAKIYGAENGYIEHALQHPVHFLQGSKKSGSWKFAEKNYYFPPTNEWFASRKYLARAIKNAGMTNEEYYLVYGKEHMPQEWHENNNNEKYGNSESTPTCLQCDKSVRFNEGKWHYPRFCSFSCSTTWHAKNTDRVAQAENTKRERLTENPDHILRPNQARYWILRGHTEEEAKELVSHRQKEGTLGRMIEKYGEEDGSERYNAGLKNRKEAIAKSEMFKGSSNVSREFFTELEKQSGLKLLYGDKEASVYASSARKYIWVDCLHRPSKTVIEFYGLFWHASPRKYVAEDVIFKSKNVTAADIWKKDERRIKDLTDSGFKVLIIWEDQYYDNPEWALITATAFLT